MMTAFETPGPHHEEHRARRGGHGRRGGFDPRGGFGPHRGGPFGGPGFGERGFGGPGFGGPGFGGHRRHGRGRARRGDVRAAVLLLLADQPMHGYQLIQEIGERTGNVWRPSPGAVYPALRLLEDEGLVTSTEGEGRRLVTLTDAGREYVATHGEELGDPFTVTESDTVDPTRELRELTHQLVGAVGQVAEAGSESQLAAAKTVLADAKRALYLILAEETPAAQDPQA